MIHILAELAPLKVSDGSRPVLRASSAQDRALNGVTGHKWWPAISKRPALAIPLFDGDFTQDVEAATASFTVRLDGLVNLDSDARGYRWAGAPVSIYAIDTSTALNAAGSYDVASLDSVRAFKGRVEGFNLVSNALTITAEIDKEPFEKDVLALTYAGTGDAEGGQDLKGRLKPWIFGRALNVEPILVNSVDSVVQFSAYPVQGISALYERGASFGPSIGNYATYAALVAANIPAGKWATCHALGMARLGAPPYGVITGDVDGDNTSGFLRRTGAIIQRIATARGIATALIDTASLNALDAAVPYDINLVLTEQISVLDLARRLARPCNAQAGLDFQGRLFAVRPTIATPILTLDAQGRQLPPVRQCQEAEVSAPYKRIMFGANRSWRVHTFDEIAFDAELIDRGDYDPAKTYRRGNIVSLPNGSRWLYVNDTPKAGSLPSETNADWELMTGAITAGNITYEDGTPVEDLKPAEPDATNGMNDDERDEFDQLAADTAAAQANIAAAHAQIAAIQSSVTADFSAVNQAVDALHGEVSAAQTNITNLQSSAGALNTSVTTLNNEMEAAQGSISGLQNSVGSLTTTASDLQTYAQNSIGALNSSVSALSTDVTNLENQAAQIISSVDGLGDQITAQGGQISTLQTAVTTQGGQISTLQTTVTNLSGSVATLTTRVDAGSQNLFPWGNFPNGLEGWPSPPAAWSSYGNSLRGNVAQVAATSSNFYLSSQNRSVQGGFSYTISLDIERAGTAGVVGARLIWTNNGVQLSGGQQLGPFATKASGSFTNSFSGRVWATGLMPTAANGYFVQLVSEGAPGNQQYRQIKVELGTVPSPWSDEASVTLTFQAVSTLGTSVATLQTTVSTQGGSITTLQSSYSSLNGTVSSLSTTVTSQGNSISTLQQTSSTQSGQISTLQSTVSTQGGSISTLQSSMSTAQGNISTLQTNVSTQGGQISTLQSSYSTLNSTVSSLSTTVSTQGASISTNAEAITTLQGAVSTLTTRVDAGSQNLFPWGNFPNGLEGWDTPAGWGALGNSLRGNFAYINASSGNHYLSSANRLIQGGFNYTVSADMERTGTAGIVAVRLIWTNNGVELTGGQQFGPTAVKVSGPFTNSFSGRVWATALMPAAANGYFVQLLSEGAPGQQQYRQIKVELGTVPSPWSDEASVTQIFQAHTDLSGSVATLSTTVSTQGGSISTLQSSMTTAQGNISTLQTTVSTQGTNITNLQTAVSTAQGDIATLKTQVTAGGGNLLNNTDLANDTSGWSFSTGNGATGGRNQPSGGSYNPASENTLSVTQSNTTSTNFSDWTQELELEPAHWYDVSVYAASHRANVQLLLQFLDSSGGVISTSQTASFAPFGGGNTLASYAVRSFKAQSPANTVKGRLVLRKHGTLSGSDSFAWFLRPQVAETRAGSATPLAYAPSSARASIVVQAQALSTLNSSFSSLTTRVTSAEGSITTLQTSMTSANGSISALQTNVSSLQGSVSTLQSSSSTQAGQISTLQSTVSTQGSNIAINAQAITALQGSVSTLTTRVDAGSQNLFPWGNFANGLDGWPSPAPQWSTYGNSLRGNVAQVAATSGNFYLSSQNRTVQGGFSYTISLDIERAGTAGIVGARLIWTNNGTPLSSGQIGATATKASGSFSNNFSGRVWGTAVMPSNANGYFVQLYSEGAAGTQQYRQIKVELGTVPSPWSDEASVTQVQQASTSLAGSLATLSTTVSTQGGSITTLQSSYSSLNGTVSTLSTTVSSQGNSISTLQQTSSTQSGQISTLQSTVSTQGGSISTLQSSVSTLQSNVSTLQTTVSTQGGSISTLQSSMTTVQGNVSTLTTRVNAGSQNLLKFGNFPNALEGWNNFGGWQVSSNAVRGNYAVSQGTGNYYANSANYSALAGWAYCLSADVERTSSSGASGARLIWTNNGADHSIGPIATKNTGSFGTTFGQRVWQAALCPSGANGFYVQLFSENANGTGVRQIKVEVGDAPSPWSDEASLSQSFQALSNLNTQFASLTSTVSTQGVTISTQATAISTLQSNVTSLFAKWSLELDVNGYVSGMVTNNNGTRADLTLRMDKVKMVTPSGLGGYWQVIFDGQGRPTQTIGDDSSGVTIEIGYLA